MTDASESDPKHLAPPDAAAAALDARAIVAEETAAESRLSLGTVLWIVGVALAIIGLTWAVISGGFWAGWVLLAIGVAVVIVGVIVAVLGRRHGVE